MVLEDHLCQRNDEGKQLKFGTSLCINSPVLLGGGTWAFASMDLPAGKFGTSLCVLLQSKYAEFESPVVMLGGEASWAFALVDLLARKFGTSLCVLLQSKFAELDSPAVLLVDESDH